MVAACYIVMPYSRSGHGCSSSHSLVSCAIVNSLCSNQVSQYKIIT